MTEENKSANNNPTGLETQASKPKLSANVSVLKAKKKEETTQPKAKAEIKQPVRKSENATAAKPENKQETKRGSEETAKTFTTDTIKEKTMAKSSSNSNNNINIPFDGFAKEAAEISREYSEACVKSGTIFMKGMEDFVGVVMSLAQSSAEKQAQFIKEAMSSKTINEFAEVQNKIAQANFDDFMAGATKLTEISTKLITESAEPVNAQIGKAIKKASQSLAA